VSRVCPKRDTLWDSFPRALLNLGLALRAVRLWGFMVQGSFVEAAHVQIPSGRIQYLGKLASPLSLHFCLSPSRSQPKELCEFCR